jgi:hypothetical protein
LIVIANYQHIKDRYPGSAVLQFLNRIRFQTDTLTDDESISRFQQTTETLIKEIREDQPGIIKSLASIETASKQAVERLIWSYCDVIPRLIQLCNRLSPSFIQTDGTRKHLEQLPGSAQRFADLSDSWIYADPNEHQDGFASVINHLYQVIYETTMVDKGPGERNQGPPVPVYDPTATQGQSYGRVRIWLQNLRNHYFHDTEKWALEQRERNQQQIKQFFTQAIEKPGPQNGTDYLRALLFILADVIWYLDTVREKLKNQ